MKSKIITFFVASILLLNTSWAQPVITGINGAPLGTKTLGYVIPGAITPGSAGANQTWDYSTIPYNATTYYFKSVDYATLSPTMQANFPTGNGANELYFGTSLAATQVFRYEPTYVSYLGLNTTVFAVPDTQLVFPHSYLETHAGFTYDAYGTLITPFGTFTNTVRLREVSGANFKYDYWQFSPVYKLMLEYQVDSVTQLVSSPAFYNMENTLSVNELEKNKGFELFPNPTSNNLSINPSFTGRASIEIVDIEGRSILYQNISAQQNVPFKIDVSNLKKGVYFFKVINESSTYSNKFIVQ